MPKIGEAARAARREQIIAAGLACFARSGYYAATMADVAAQAGVSKGTPYLYFDSKEALFLALHEEWDCGAGDRVNAAIAALPDDARRSPRAVLHAVAAAIAAHVQAESKTCRVLMEARALAAHEPAIAAAVRAADDRAHRQLEDLIAAGIRAGEWPPGTDPALAARLFTAGLYGLMAQWHLALGSFSWESAVAALAGSPDCGAGDFGSYAAAERATVEQVSSRPMAKPADPVPDKGCAAGRDEPRDGGRRDGRPAQSAAGRSGIVVASGARVTKCHEVAPWTRD